MLAVIGGAAVALALSMFGAAAAVGFLWIFVFGDDSWPAWFEPAANAAILVVGLVLWVGSARLIWLQLKRT